MCESLKFIVTSVPPLVGPPCGEMLVTAGVGTYTNTSAAVFVFGLVPAMFVPEPVVTVTYADSEPGGDSAVHWLSVQLAFFAGTLSKATVPPARLAPVIVTDVPPPEEPASGWRPVTAGAAGWSTNTCARGPPASPGPA